MSGVYFLLAIIGVGIIIVWYIQNDNVPPGQPTRGLLRMRESGDAASAGTASSETAGQGSRYPATWTAGASNPQSWPDPKHPS